MKAIFKPEDANKLIVRDADINEASLIINFLDKISKGATLETKACYNGNYEVNGILFSLADVVDPVITPSYIEVAATVINDIANLPVFKIDVKATSGATSFKIDSTILDTVKATLEGLGLTDVSATTDGVILANNPGDAPISASIVIPKGLFQFVTEDANTNNFNDNLVITLGE